MNNKTQPISKAQVVDAIVQAWHAPKNKHKMMDIDLANAIIANIWKLLDGREK